MRMKKLVSALSALTLAAGTFAGMAVTANATNWESISPTHASSTSANATAEEYRIGQKDATLLKFDISDIKESGETITEAKLSFKIASRSYSTERGRWEDTNVFTYALNENNEWNGTDTLTWSSVDRLDKTKAYEAWSGTKTTSGQDVPCPYVPYTADVKDALVADTDGTITFALYTSTAREQGIEASSVKLTVTSIQAKTYTVTVNYLDKENKPIADPLVVENVVENTLFKPEYSETISDDVNKYIYESGAEEYTIKEDTTINIYYTSRPLVTSSVIVKATGDLEKEILSGLSVVEDKDLYFNFPRYIVDNDILYEASVSQSHDGKGFEGKVTGNDTGSIVKTIEYKKAHTDALGYTFIEAENVEGLQVVDDSARLSNGKGAISTQETVITTLPAGKYTLYVDDRNHGNAKTATYSIMAGDEVIAERTINAYIAQGAYEFELEQATEIKVSAISSETESNITRFGIDYFLFVKTENVVTPATAEAVVVGDYTSETETDNVASLWKLNVKAGTNAINSVGVEMKSGDDNTAKGNTIEGDTVIAGGSDAVFAIVVNKASEDITEVNALLDGTSYSAYTKTIE